MKCPRNTLILVLVLGVQSGEAYELATHGRLTLHAYQRSVTASDYVVDGLGITVDALGGNYYDIYRGDIHARTKNDFEQAEPRMPRDVDPLSIVGWLMRGAIREDDHIGRRAPNPQDDPYNNNDWILDNRPLHHFYDPRNDQGLRVGLRIGQKAPDWGIGADDAFADENAADQWRRNHFTVFDAREAMFRALTGMSGSGSRAIGAGGSTPNTAADKEAVRKAYWATAFRALGDLVHLIQDMAQPQHTRNDPHAGSDNYDQAAGPAGHKSFYESYIEARAAQTEIVESNSHRYTPDALVYDNGYPIPRFNSYAEYFSTQHLESSVMARKGMADYSNRGFFSIGKNLGQGDYDLPPNSISGGFYTPEPRVVSLDGATVHVLKGSVSDAQAGITDTDVPLTAFGAWNDALQQTTGQDGFTLIRENYDAMANLLIPRAVAYSAGLIDYFFRGRMAISLPDEGVYAILDHAVENAEDDGFRKIKLKLKNDTPTISEGQTTHTQAMTNGKLWAVVKFHRNTCYRPDLSGQPMENNNGCNFDAARSESEEMVVSQPIEIQSLSSSLAQPFTFDFGETPIPVGATDIFLQVVYRGGLGSEADAVVVATKDISEPTFVAISNYTDYFLQDGNFYHWEDPELRQLADYNGDGLPDEDIYPINLAYSFSFGGPQLGSVTLPPARHCQIAILTELSTFRMYIHKSTFGYRIDPVKDSYVLRGTGLPGKLTGMKFMKSRGFYRYINWPDWKYSRYGPPQGDTSVMEDFEDMTPVAIDLSFE